MFARLLPMTLRYVELALRPDKPDEKDPTAMMSVSCDARPAPVDVVLLSKRACYVVVVAGVVPASLAKAADSSLIDVSMDVSFSSELNCASCAMNSPLSCGLSGSWLASWVVSSLMNASWPSLVSRPAPVPVVASFDDAEFDEMPDTLTAHSFVGSRSAGSPVRPWLAALLSAHVPDAPRGPVPSAAREP